MRKLRKGENYALLPTIDSALNTIKRSPLRFAHRDDEESSERLPRHSVPRNDEHNKAIVLYGERSSGCCNLDDDEENSFWKLPDRVRLDDQGNFPKIPRNNYLFLPTVHGSLFNAFKRSFQNRERSMQNPRTGKINVTNNNFLGSILRICCLFFICVLFSDAQAQPAGERVANGLGDEVSIGHRVPPEFWTKEHLFYINGDTVRKTLEGHKGKLIVLDFWFSGCAPCLIHQKEIKNFVRDYPEDLVVIMVNSRKTKEGYDKINDLYGKGYFEKFGIDHFETIIEDEYLMSVFPSTSYPHYVWINSLGRLQLKTFRNLLDRNYVAPFIDRP